MVVTARMPLPMNKRHRPGEFPPFTPFREIILRFTGGGTLNLLNFGFPRPFDATGEGNLSASTAGTRAPVVGPLTGAGSLTNVTRVQITASLSGGGSLGGSAFARFARTGVLTGDGSLVATQVVPRQFATGILAGSGALAAVKIVPVVPVSGAASGSGSLSAKVVVSVSADLSGEGFSTGVLGSDVPYPSSTTYPSNSLFPGDTP